MQRTDVRFALGGLLVGAVLAIIVSRLGSLQPPPPTKAESGQVPQHLSPESNHEPTGDEQVAQSSPATVNQDESNPNYPPHSDEANPQTNEASREWWSWFNATAVTCFTAVLMVVAALQWRLMRQQSGIMRDEMEQTRIAAVAAQDTVEQMRLEQRAWICIGRAEIELIPDAPINYSVTITNTGLTPGEIVSFGCVIAPLPQEMVSDAQVEEVLRDMDPETRGLIIAPGLETTLRFKEPCHSTDIEHIQSGKLWLLIFCVIHYLDVRDQKRTTKQCLIYEHQTGRLVPYRKHGHMD